MVYVISQDGKPLMPCSNTIARLLLKQGKAKVKRREPFTIKLTYETTSYTQDLTLGVDTGSGTIGTAVSKNNGDIVYISEIIVRNDITDKMTQRAKYRRNRRNRKTRYRKAKWLNRANSIKNDRFSPTMQSKLHSHVKEIEYIKSILPITKLVFETGQFDMHLMKNPSLASPKVKHWGYQKGANYGVENIKAMVLNRDNYTCQCCRGKHKDSKLEVHHIIYRSQGGSDEADNLITLCHTCHKALHDGKINPKLSGKTKGNLKYATQMNSIRKQLFRLYPGAIETFGYITKANRLRLGVNKEHYHDACTIATQGDSFALKTNLYKKKCISDGDFQKTKGIRSEQPIETKKICGFRKFDKVRYFGKEYFIKGRMSTGYAILMDIEGKKIDFSSMPKGYKTPKLNNCMRIAARTSQIIQTVAM
ncbi:HNH endonuclease [Butyrivibrio fibrisolvens DSM 3071]|uniref:HNH endonuclease n=1 Tax=Butyrivibrio fibrisolvens DSM 3071 TaxID=1121131 RepID=A0A1M5ZLE2_BUTFI|nr:RNA-guided endonuclease IscB [Butyrivibrio fibrisolvens]SHI25040.1 HNH endonuclease [Butyrivibrio fibrisolvens DSM 3071]